MRTSTLYILAEGSLKARAEGAMSYDCKYREHSSKSHFGSHQGERTEWLYFPQFENYRRFPGFLADPEATTICLPHSRPPQKILLQATNSLSAKKALLPSHDLWYFISLLPYLLLSMSNRHSPPPINDDNVGIQESFSFWPRHCPDLSSCLQQQKKYNRRYVRQQFLKTRH